MDATKTIRSAVEAYLDQRLQELYKTWSAGALGAAQALFTRLECHWYPQDDADVKAWTLHALRAMLKEARRSVRLRSRLRCLEHGDIVREIATRCPMQ